MENIAVVIGVGASRGLGAAVARRFAREGLSVLLVGRTQERLQQVAGEIEQAGGTASMFVADATDAGQVANLFEYAAGAGRIRSVIFNVGNNAIIPFDELTAETFEKFWRICTHSAFLAASSALPLLEEQGGSLLFTGASASLRGRPNFAHFSAAKGALRNLAQSLAREYGPRGVHVGHVVVDGVIDGEMVRTRLPEYLEHLGEEGSLDPDAIAEAFWYLHSQPKRAWSFELDIRPSKENW